jgi:PKD repeat protein
MEQWRSGSNAAVNEICAFEYSTDATDLLTGTWTAVTSFDFVEKLTSTTTAAALDGNLPENQTPLTATLVGLIWPAGTNLWIRWSDVDNTGSDGLYSIDNLSVTVSGSSSPVISVTSPAAGNQWKQGSTHAITWVASNTNPNVKIEFSDNASAGTPTWTTLNASIATSAGSWTWNIPAGQTLSTDCKIRITDIPVTATGLSATFSIVPPPAQISTLAALRAATPGTVYTYTGQGVLTFQQAFRHQKYIQDATAGILIDDNAGAITTAYAVGDALTNITGTVAEFGGMMQFTPESDPGAPASTGNVISPEIVTLTQLTNNWEDYESELVRLANLTFTGATGNFANGVVYPVADNTAVTGNFRTTFFDVDYINTPVPVTALDMVVLPNSRTDGNYITSRNLADFFMLIPTLTVTYPNGGQFLQQGSTQNITWLSNNFTGNVKIELTGSNPSVLAASVANTGSFTWNVPASQVIAADYKIKISDATDGDPMDESNSTFSVVAPYTIPDLVITEIMYNSPSNDEEWIEIYNNGTSTVDMSGYYILDDDPAHIADPIVLPAGTSLAAGDRFTVENATAGFFPFVPDYDGSGKFSFGNTTDQVKLYHKYGQLIDSVKYSDASPWPTGPDGGGSTLTLCDPTLNNSIASSWSASTEPFVTLQGSTIYATPGAGCYVSSDNIMITEIMYNPIDGGNDTIEFIEIYNKGSVEVNLKDWYFSQGVTYVFPDVTLTPNEYFIVAREAAAMQSTFGITCAQWAEGFLDDAGEPIVLKDAIGQIKDSVYYLPTEPWPTTPNNGGPSLTFCNTTLDNSLGENWSASANQIAVNGVGQPIFASPGTSCISGANLVITEIMYNPPESGTDSLEFIELYNAGYATNLQGFYFSSGVDYIFPSVTIASGEYILVAYNASAIQSTFGKTALQWSTGGLNNTGEAIILKDNFGITIDEVTYADAAPWDSLADGHGPSLTLCDPASNNALPINWKASSEFVTTNAAGDSIFATPLGGCVNPPTVANFEANPTSLLEGEDVQFHDLSTNNPTAWEWIFPGGTPAASTEQNPLIKYNTYGVYSVTLKATNEYGNSTLTKTDYISVGVDGISTLPSSVSAYPNPTSGRLFITNPSQEIQEILIFSANGKQVSSLVSDEEIISINITGQPKGLYLIRMNDKISQEVKVIKVILK